MMHCIYEQYYYTSVHMLQYVGVDGDGMLEMHLVASQMLVGLHLYSNILY